MKTIYLAGKAHGEKWNAAPQHDYVQYVSSDGRKHSEHRWGIGEKSFRSKYAAALVQERFIETIKTADALFAYIDSPHCYGTIAEIAYASALGMPCYVAVVYPKSDSQEQEWRDGSMPDAYWFVSNFPHVVTFAVNDRDGATFLFVQALGHALCESPVERSFWDAIIRRSLGRELPIPQYALNGYRLDFSWPGPRIAVEIDGHDYHKTKEQRSRDAKRDRELTKLGWTTLRFTGSDVYKNADAVADEVLQILPAVTGK